MLVIPQEDIKISYGKFSQDRIINLYASTMESNVTKLEDIQTGDFIIPTNAIAVSFSYTKTESINVNNKIFKNKEHIYTGKFFENGELYDLSKVEAEFGKDHEFYKNMAQDDNPHSVKTKAGLYFKFCENDVIVTGKNGEWIVTQRHPNASEIPEYILPIEQNNNEQEDFIEQANVGQKVFGSRRPS